MYPRICARERPVRVVAEVDLDDLHPRELRLVLVEVVDLLLADRRLHDDRGQRIEAARLDLASERAGGHVQHLGEPLHDVVPALVGHVADPELDRGTGDVRDDDAAAPVEERPARRLDADQSQLVALGRVQVLVAGEHLEGPEPEEEDDEHGERDGAEHRHAQRELRRETVWLAHPRVGREEATRRGPSLLVRPGRHLRRRPRPPPTARHAAPRPRARGRADEREARASG